MATKQLQPITVSSLRGAVNDNDPPTSLPADVCTIAENVEFFYSTLGERRAGCTAVTLPATITGDANITAVTWMGTHYPTNSLGAIELWAFGQSLTAANNVLTRNVLGVWSTVTPDDAITSTYTSGYGPGIRGASLHGKFYTAYKSSVDQLHVWDGTSLRKCGLAAPSAAPTAADSGGAGALAGKRYYRVRYVTMSGTTVLRRGEPSAVLGFTPSGANASITVTRPALISQGETHWEIEASTDNANFYRVSQIAVATTTYVDSVVFATGYASGGTLSETLTAYTLIPSGKYLTTDADRLIIGGSWENSAYGSRIWWTPVLGSTGVGNDERLDMTVNPYIDLDGFEGGDLTGLSHSVNGYLYAFKWGAIYKILRKGQATAAYDAVPITKSRGAFPNSLVEGVDQAGNPALYFLDPLVGPMRIGTYGLEWLGRDLRTTWGRVNQNAVVPAHGVFYQTKNQVHFWVALDGATHPNFKIVVHCDQIVSDENGGRRGWVTVPVGDRISDAYCSLMFSTNVDSGDIRGFLQTPFIGKGQWAVSGVTIKNLIQRCDVGTTDAFTTGDTVAYYRGKVQTRPFSPVGVSNETALLAATLVVAAASSPANDVHVQAVKNFGIETKTLGVDLFPDGDEDVLVKQLDNLSFSEMNTVQFTFGDLDKTINPTTNWQLQLFSAKLTSGQTD
jgi:hypothetical protein